MSKINVGIIGCGAISIHRHAPEYSANAGCEIAGYFDPVSQRAKALCDRFGGSVYSSVEEMLSDEKIDAVSVCTSNATHAPISIEALSKGKHVLCEKPMAITFEDCTAMGKEAEQAGKVLMVGHNQRFAPAHVKAKSILESDELGKVITFRTTFGHRGPEFWSADKSVNTWFFNKGSAFLGAAADLGIHKLDLIMWLLEDTVQTVSAYCNTLDKKDSEGNPIGVDDNMICNLKMKNGAMGTLTASWTYYGDEDNSTVLYCENGIIRIYDNPDYPVEVVKRNGERSYYKVGAIQTNDDKVQANSGVIDAFVDAVVNRHTPAVPFEDAIEAMKVIFACVESSNKQTFIRL